MSHSKSIKGPIAALDRNKIEISPFFLNEKMIIIFTTKNNRNSREIIWMDLIQKDYIRSSLR